MADHEAETKTSKPIISNSSLYDSLKYLALIGLPAISAAYFGLGKIWGFPNVEEIIGSIAVIDTLLGGLLGLSRAQYTASVASAGPATDGEIHVDSTDEDQIIKGLAIDGTNADLTGKKTITLKVTDLGKSQE